MSKIACSICLDSNTRHECGLCKGPICKACSAFIPAEAFLFLPKTPPDLEHSVYCAVCFEKNIVHQIRSYEEVMENAKNVTIFFKSQSKKTTGINHVENPVQVFDCPDYDEAILRLAFQASLLGCNTLVDVLMTSKKQRNHGYQSTDWTAVGIPTKVSNEKLGQLDRLKY